MIKGIYLLEFLLTKVKNLSVQLVYATLLMYFAYKNENTPPWAKRIILGAFAYLISPIDSIPDLTPFIGFTDDFGVLSFGLVSIACYITSDIRAEAKNKMNQFFKKVNEVELSKVDGFL